MSGAYDPDTLLTTGEAADAARRSPATIRSWAYRGRLVEAGRTAPDNLNQSGCPLYRRGDVLDAERSVRSRDGSARAAAAVSRRDLQPVAAELPVSC